MTTEEIIWPEEPENIGDEFKVLVERIATETDDAVKRVKETNRVIEGFDDE